MANLKIKQAQKKSGERIASSKPIIQKNKSNTKENKLKRNIKVTKVNLKSNASENLLVSPANTRSKKHRSVEVSEECEDIADVHTGLGKKQKKAVVRPIQANGSAEEEESSSSDEGEQNGHDSSIAEQLGQEQCRPDEESGHCMFLQNVASEATLQDLRGYFYQFGAKKVVMLPEVQLSSGCKYTIALIVFKTEAALRKALATVHAVDGNILRSFATREEALNQCDKDELRFQHLYVQNISPDTTHETISRMFQQYGETKYVRMINYETEQGTVFTLAHVVYISETARQKALEVTHAVDGALLRTYLSEVEAKDQCRKDLLKFHHLYVQNISPNTSCDTLTELFKQYGETEFVRLMKHETEQGTACTLAHVAYTSETARQKALQVTHAVDGKLLRTFSSMQEVKEQLKLEDAECHHMFVENISPDMTSNVLRKYFRRFGNTKNVHVLGSEIYKGRQLMLCHVVYTSETALQEALRITHAVDGRILCTFRTKLAALQASLKRKREGCETEEKEGQIVAKKQKTRPLEFEHSVDVSNLGSGSVKKGDIVKHFRQYGSVVNVCYDGQTSDNKKKIDVAVVAFEELSAVEAACAAKGQQIDSSAVTVKRTKKAETRATNVDTEDDFDSYFQ